MDWIWYLLLIIALLFGLFLNVLTLPGLWFMVASSAIYAWITHWQHIGLRTLGILVGIGVISELVEFVAGGAGAKKAGGSTRAAWGALLGGAAGALLLSIPVPIVGTILGACFGAFAGAWLAEFSVHGQTTRSIRVGMGAARGKLLGILSKLAFSMLILAIALWTALP